jgi:hypothetical protein
VRRSEDFTRALMMGVQLNEEALLAQALEAVPFDSVPLVARQLPVRTA